MKQAMIHTKSAVKNGNVEEHITQMDLFYFRFGMLPNTSFSSNKDMNSEKSNLNKTVENTQSPIKSINLSEFALQLANA